VVTQPEVALEVDLDIQEEVMPHQVVELPPAVSMALYTGPKNPEVVVGMVLVVDGFTFKPEVMCLWKEQSEPMVLGNRQVRLVEEAVEPSL